MFLPDKQEVKRIIFGIFGREEKVNFMECKFGFCSRKRKKHCIVWGLPQTQLFWNIKTKETFRKEKLMVFWNTKEESKLENTKFKCLLQGLSSRRSEATAV